MRTDVILGNFRSVSKFRGETPSAEMSNRDSWGNYHFNLGTIYRASLQYKPAIMMSSRWLRRLDVFRLLCRSRIFLLIIVAISLCLVYTYNKSRHKTLRYFAPASKGQIINTSLLTSNEDVLKVLVRSNGYLAATRTIFGKDSSHSSVCVVDPAIADCTNLGFAAFLLITLDHIMLCRAVGSDRPVVVWRACFSGCSRDRRVNSWNWYFEPVNRGLVTQAEKVLCPLIVENVGDFVETFPELKPILNNSFKNRSKVAGFADSPIITTKERMRINKLIKQYVKPNSRITDKVSKFYHRYLAGYTVLGVHVRGTDHWMETNEQRLPPLMSWVKSAQAILETVPQPRKIFIASDNDEVIEKFVTFFGKEMVSFIYFVVFFKDTTWPLNTKTRFSTDTTNICRALYSYVYIIQEVDVQC